ncbi:MAG: UvrB/UvrC motif-containing protein [Bacillota bacterium]|nr:UvrB/UvrC motif-containing protein [Bacillota bacterium]
MLCERCKQNPATMHYTQVINGQVTEYHLCEACAREENISFDMPEFDLINLFAPKREVKSAGLICPFCKTTLNEFRETGIAGCHKCYEVFEPVILPMLEGFHGCSKHKDVKKEAKPLTAEDKIEKLQKELGEAVKAEEYEKAASIRDEIKALKEEK